MKGLLYSSVPNFFKAMEEMNGKDLEGENIEIVLKAFLEQNLITGENSCGGEHHHCHGHGEGHCH